MNGIISSFGSNFPKRLLRYSAYLLQTGVGNLEGLSIDKSDFGPTADPQPFGAIGKLGKNGSLNYPLYLWGWLCEVRKQSVLLPNRFHIWLYNGKSRS